MTHFTPSQLAAINLTAAIFLNVSSAALGQPNQGMVYTNNAGGYQNTFVLKPNGEVSGARYRFANNEPIQFDRLTYVRDVEFPDGRDNSPPVVRGWMYKGSDKTENTWRIIFGRDQNTNSDAYPVYYSLQQNGQFTRWQLPGGTRRRPANLQDEVYAVLWANQVDIDRLGLQPFSPQQMDPLAPSLAWKAVLPELNKTLARRNGGLSASLLQLPGGRLQFDLDVTPNLQAEMFQILQYANDIPIRIVKESKTRQITLADLSPQYLTNGSIDLSKVAQGISSLIEFESAALAPYQLQGESRIGADSCFVSSRPWRRLNCDPKYCQFWKVRFGFEIVNDGGGEQYKLSTVFDIGECHTFEQNLGERFIIHKYTSKEAEGFDVYTTTVASPGSGPIVGQQIYTVARGVDAPPGVSVAQPAVSYSNLKDVFKASFDDYIQKMTGG